MADGPLVRAGDALRLTVRLTPRGGRDALGGSVMLADGRTVATARVRAVPEDGKANAALVALVAAAAGVPRARVLLETGATGRLKTLRIEAAGPDAEAALRAIIASDAAD